MLGGKGLRLLQRFAGHGGDMGAVALHADVKGQIADRVGRRPVQRAGRSRPAGGLVHAGGVDAEVLDLFVGQQHLGAQPVRRVLQRRTSQARKLRPEVFGVERRLTHQPPAARGPVKQPDAVERQGQGKAGFHRADTHTEGGAKQAHLDAGKNSA